MKKRLTPKLQLEMAFALKHLLNEQDYFEMLKVHIMCTVELSRAKREELIKPLNGMEYDFAKAVGLGIQNNMSRDIFVTKMEELQKDLLDAIDEGTC